MEQFALRTLDDELGLYGPDIEIAVSVSEVLIQGSATFTPLNGVAPFRFHISLGGGRIDPSGVFTAGAVLGTNTITVTDATGNFGRAQINVSGGRGDGTFMGSVNYAATNDPTSIHSGDFTNDGIVDLVVGTDATTHRIRLFEGNGDGTFQAGTANTTDGGTRALTVGDINQDGNLDVVGAGNSNTFNLFRGNADATFMTRLDYTNGTNQHGIDAGDVDNDGLLDIVTANLGADMVTLWPGNGDGTFQTAVPFGAHNDPRHVLLSDFNYDGNLDVLSSNVALAPSINGGATLYPGNGDGTFQGGTELAAAGDSYQIGIGDFNGDRVLDILTFELAAGGDITLFLGNGDGSFYTGSVTTLPATGNTGRGGAACDYNGDGHMDLAVADSGNNTVVVLFGDGAGNFSVGPQLAAGGPTHMVHCRDLNDDDRMDLALVNFSSDQMRVFLGN